MTDKRYQDKRTTDRTLNDLYEIAGRIDEKVEDILDSLRELVDSQADRHWRGYDLRDYENGMD